MEQTSKDAEMKPRSYQLELVDYLCERNGILYLPTGAGKTFVAILVLKRLSHNLQNTVPNGGKRSIFMCNTVELARQQCIEIRKCTNLNVGLFIGDRDVDNWSRKKWQMEFDENQVFVGTAQVFVDIVTQNLMKITDFNLVIIDECHHATKNHPMHSFLALVQNAAQFQQPRVIGLTGVLIKGNKLNAIEQELRNLEVCFRGNIVTVRTMQEFHNVMVYSTKPEEQMVTYNSNNYTYKVESKINTIIEKWRTAIDRFDIGTVVVQLTKGLTKQREPNKKKFVKNLIDDFVYQMKDFGLYAASVAITSLTIEFEVKKRQAESIALRNMYRYCVLCCEQIRHLLVAELKSMVDEEDNANTPIRDEACHTKSVILNYSTSKMTTFLLSLTNMLKGKQFKDVACLVFVQRRYTAKCVFYVLQNYIRVCPEMKDVIVPQFMVGRKNIIASIESILDTKWNKNVMEQFRQKECNLVVCSSVLEEGIDVQACNYVFVLDELVTFNSYIQTKGRARSKNAFYTIFCDNANRAGTMNKIHSYKKAHEEIRNFLMRRVLHCEEPNMDEVAQQFATLIPPFQISSGAQLVATSVLALLNRYCQALPWDSFGSILPWFYKLPCDLGCQVALELPLQSTLKETIRSDVMKNVKEAKVSAAFKACVKLYQLGELNDHLLPITKTECIQKVSDDLFKHWKKYNDDAAAKNCGKTYNRLYDRQCPAELYDALPKVGQKCYAYPMKFLVDFQPNPYNEHVVKYLGSTSTFAILLRKSLPKVAEMPLFMSQGRLRVQIAEEPIECMVNSARELENLEGFHTMLFRDLLELWKGFFVIDHRNKENAYLIVPINSSNAIDWDLVEKFQRLVPSRVYPLVERSRKSYRAEDFLDRVVTKWYNEMENERFVVTKVRHDLNPLSLFDGSKHYAEYYKSRYGVITSNCTQFLLEVKTLTKRRNFFINAMGKSMEIKKERNEIILIPELCHNFNFPADMWLKALFLPTILHRVYYTLHAEALRRRINTFLGIDEHIKDYKPHALIVDSSLKRAVDYDGVAIKQDKECKKFLSTLSPKTHMQQFKVQNLDVPWKEYMEPVDYSRRLINVYPVEIDYYHNFINGLVSDIEKMRIVDEEIWTQSQLEMPNMNELSMPKPSRNSLLLGKVPNISKLAIKHVPEKDKYHLDILERSLKGVSDLQSAEQYEFLAAITTAAVNDVFDMERFELLGDAFLKFSVSLYLANKYPKWNEGYLTTIKGRAVSNRNLLYCMLETDICRRICGSTFSPSVSWLPPLAALPSNLLQLLQECKWPALANLSPDDFYSMQLTEEEIRTGVCQPDKLSRFVHSCRKAGEMAAGNVEMNIDNDMNMYIYKEALRDKVVADTLEAILGVCVKNYGIQRIFQMLHFFGIIQPDPAFPLNNLLQLELNISPKRVNVESRNVDSFLVNRHMLEKNLGYTFKDRTYLLQALTHPSNPTNRLTGCYQELEFIGDAILDMLVTCYIFERFEYMTPGKMTDMRMALVNNITLGCVCVRHRFHLYMLYENAALAESIKTFAAFQETQNYYVTDLVRILLEEDSNDSLEEDDTFEDEDDTFEDETYDDASSCSTKWPENKSNTKYNMSGNVDVPKALGDIVEALIAAVYLDCRDLKTTWRVIYNLMEPEILGFAAQVPIDPIRQLNEYKMINATFSKPIVDNDTVLVKCAFNCLDKRTEVNGFGSNIKYAKKAAAKHALRILSKHSN